VTSLVRFCLTRISGYWQWQTYQLMFRGPMDVSLSGGDLRQRKISHILIVQSYKMSSVLGENILTTFYILVDTYSTACSNC